jgi:hypothetical protein
MRLCLCSDRGNKLADVRRGLMRMSQLILGPCTLIQVRFAFCFSFFLFDLRSILFVVALFGTLFVFSSRRAFLQTPASSVISSFLP